MKHIWYLLKFYRRELFICFIALLSFFVFVPIFTYIYFAKDLESKTGIMNKNDTGVILLDRNNKPFYSFYQAKAKDFVSIEKVPKYTQESLIASEDKDFYKHSGFSFYSLTRAFFMNLTQHDVLYGGSTITQQLVKNSLLNSNKNYFRKFQEIVLAQEIERRYSKQEILEMYLNSVYFGDGAFGIENAAKQYYNKDAQNLTLAESSFLTALLPSPTTLSPYTGSLQQAKLRQKIVLQKMADQQYITQAEMEKALREKLAFHKPDTQMNSIAQHFALYVRDELIRQYGEANLKISGFRVHTTLDTNWQKKAENTVAEQVNRLHADNVSNGAAVVIDPRSGDVKALVGSADWYNNKFGKMNMALTPRSVGSSFKPIVYSAAFEKRIITPATVLQDSPVTFPGNYSPLDYDRKFRGSVQVRRALANSLNIPAVEVMQKVGLLDAMDMAKRFGITSLKDSSNYGLSFVLGTGEVNLLEMTSVYATFANQGVRAEPRTILDITNKQGNKIYTAQANQKKVLEPEVAFLISSILSDNNARAEEFGNELTISRTAAVKTGTAEDYKDALTLGYTPSLAIGVWVGNNDNESMDTVAGSLGAAPIWKKLMETYLKGTTAEAFTKPANIVQLPVCSDGLLAADTNRFNSYRTEYFINGTQPFAYCARKEDQQNNDQFFSKQGNNKFRGNPYRNWQNGNTNRDVFDQFQQNFKDFRKNHSRANVD